LFPKTFILFGFPISSTNASCALN